MQDPNAVLIRALRILQQRYDDACDHGSDSVVRHSVGMPMSKVCRVDHEILEQQQIDLAMCLVLAIVLS